MEFPRLDLRRLQLVESTLLEVVPMLRCRGRCLNELLPLPRGKVSCSLPLSSRRSSLKNLRSDLSLDLSSRPSSSTMQLRTRWLLLRWSLRSWISRTRVSFSFDLIFSPPRDSSNTSDLDASFPLSPTYRCSRCSYPLPHESLQIGGHFVGSGRSR